MAKQGGGVPPPVTVSVWAPPTDETQQKNWQHLKLHSPATDCDSSANTLIKTGATEKKAKKKAARARAGFSFAIFSFMFVNTLLYNVLAGMLGTSNRAGLATTLLLPVIAVWFEITITWRIRWFVAQVTLSVNMYRRRRRRRRQQKGNQVAPVAASSWHANLSDLVSKGGASHLHAFITANVARWRARASESANKRPPVIFHAHVPSPAYLATCAGAAATLERHLQQAPDHIARELAMWLHDKYGLHVKGSKGAANVKAAVQKRRLSLVEISFVDDDPASSSSSGGGSSSSSSSSSSLESAEEALKDAKYTAGGPARRLRSLALRYPESPLPLAQGRFAWSVTPLRARGEEAVERGLRGWVDTTASAAEASIFSSTGVWTSPYAPGWMAGCFTVQGLVAVRLWAQLHEKMSTVPLFVVGATLSACGLGLAAVALKLKRRMLARWVWGGGLALGGVCYLAESVLAACKCVAPYDRLHAPPGNPKFYDYPWQWSLNMVFLGCAWLCAALAAAWPWLTFQLMCFGCPLLILFDHVPVAATGFVRYGPTIFVNAITSSTMLCTTAYLWTGRRRNMLRAQRMARADAARYVAVWDALTAQEGTRAALGRCLEVWREVQGGATELRKLQWENCRSLFHLLRQADWLNDPFQLHLHTICMRHGGRFTASPVKDEQRALQKVFRSYFGEWRKLCDLVRCSLTFGDLDDLAACLRAIGQDPELEVVRVGDDKMRLRDGFDAASLSGGYRDIQLCVRLRTDLTRGRGVEFHLAECQLHYEPMAALKSDGGHANYVLRRNLGGQ